MTVVCVANSFLPSTWNPIHEASQLGIAGAALILIAVGGAITSIRRLRKIAAAMRDQWDSSK